MLTRFALCATTTLLFAASAAAQLPIAQPKPVTSQVKNGGVYHMATGTWTRGVTASALAGPEAFYDNTCTTGFYFGSSTVGNVWDSGRLPSTSSPTNASSLTGQCNLYRVNGFEVGYCSFAPGPMSFDVSFTDCYAACDLGGVLPTPLVTFNIVNAPGGAGSGAQACWIVAFDLANASFSFNLGGDCNGGYNNAASTDSFGWSWALTSQPAGSADGPIMAGDPMGFFPQSGQTCGGIGAGTTFVGAAPGAGTGIGVLDQMEIGNGPLTPGCYWFGGYSASNPYTTFYLQVQGENCSGGNPGNGNGLCYGGALCPCGNPGGPGRGCANSLGANSGASLTARGAAFFSSDTLSFAISGVNGTKPGLMLRGNNPLAGGTGSPVGDGLICIAGGSQRSQVQLTSAGAVIFTDWNGSGFGSVANMGTPTYFQYWYRDPQNGPCGNNFNFSNAWIVTYMP